MNESAAGAEAGAKAAAAGERPVALVTGASRGLGAAMVGDLARRGWQVIAVARTQGALEELDDRVRAEGSSGAITLAPTDLLDEDAVRQLCRGVHDRWGGIALWVHAAVQGSPLSPADAIVTRDLERAVALNVTGTAFLIAMIEPLLRPRQGMALFFDDPRPGSAFAGAYGATKAGQIALARAWAAEGIRIGPRVVIETPAPMATRLRAGFHPGEDRARLASPADEAARILDRLFA